MYTYYYAYDATHLPSFEDIFALLIGDFYLFKRLMRSQPDRYCVVMS